jgi:NAD(P)H-hydrate epimerase
MTLPLPANKSGTLGKKALLAIVSFIRNRKISAVAIGPGLGINSDTESIVEKLLKISQIPMVVDADALTIVSRLKLTRKGENKLIFTPNAGEFSRLCGKPVSYIRKHREASAAEFSEVSGSIIVLKGHRTVVADQKNIFVNTTGNPGMAKGGSGDVLAGMISALIAQVKEPKLLNASLAGAYVHGLSGDLVLKKKPEISMTASDIIDSIANAFRNLQ